MDKKFGAACAVSFSLGVLAGGIFTSKKLESAYQNKLREDLDSAREERRKFLRRSRDEKEESKKKKTDIPQKPEETRKDEVLKAKVRDLKYDIPQGHPYVISPEEFGEYDDYERITFTYYADGVLADDCDQIVDDYDDIVGNDFSDHFGEYEQDSVYVRNDERKTDYEILLSLSSYKELLGEKPYLLSDDI